MRLGFGRWAFGPMASISALFPSVGLQVELGRSDYSVVLFCLEKSSFTAPQLSATFFGTKFKISRT